MRREQKSAVPFREMGETVTFNATICTGLTDADYPTDRLSDNATKHMIEKYGKWLLIFSAYAALLYFPLFLKLDYLPFRIWDEARPAVQAYEMARSHDYLITTYEGQPDTWYTKPPLMVWLQLLCIKLIGYNELAIRLPSALAALFTCLFIGRFLYRNTGSRWAGMIAGLVLVTTYGYVHVHSTRTGDVDALLAFFLLFSAFSLYDYLRDVSKKKYLYRIFLGLALAVMTKSVAGLFWTPAMLLFVLSQKKLGTMLRDKHLYFGLLLFLAVPATYYALREQAQPGYLKLVWENEWLGRYNETLEEHRHGFWFYYERLTGVNFTLWICLFPVGALIGLFGPDKRWRNITGYCLLLFFQYFLLISCSRTKTYWYDVPLYPLWAILIAMAIYRVYYLLAYGLVNRGAAGLFLFMVFCIPYKKTFDRIGRRAEPEYYDEPFYTMSYYIRESVKGHGQNLNGVRVANGGYHGHLLPYKYRLDEMGQHISFIHHDAIRPGDEVLAHQMFIKEHIDSHYVYAVQDTFKNVTRYHIEARKD